MATVTGRIHDIKQPWGGYLPPKLFLETQLSDRRNLHEHENISPLITGLVVDDLTRLILSGSVTKAFEVSWYGVIAAEVMGQTGSIDLALDLRSDIDGLNDGSIVAACKFCSFDVWYRNPAAAFKAPRAEDINPDAATIENIRLLTSRSIDFFKEYGPVIDMGFSFSDDQGHNGYTSLVSAGDGDYLTKDTLWDLKVSVRKPTSAHTLQILMYYLMGKHSGMPEYENISKIGIFNPRLNTAYTLDVDSVSGDVIREVEQYVIGYRDKGERLLWV